MKKIANYLGVFVGLFFFTTGETFASEVTWNDLVSGIKRDFATSYTITISDDMYNDKIHYLILEKDDIDISFYIDERKGNVVSLEGRMFSDDVSFNEKLSVASKDSMICLDVILKELAKLNGIDSKKILEKDFARYGILYDHELLAYKSVEGEFWPSVMVDYVNDFSIDLDKFENEVKKLQNDSSQNLASAKFGAIKSATDEVELNIIVNGLVSGQGKCAVYMSRDASGTNFSLVSKIDCQNGTTKYVVPELQANETYYFKVSVLENNKEVALINWTKGVTLEEVADKNPSTGATSMIMVVGIFCLSVVSFLVVVARKDRMANSI